MQVYTPKERKETKELHLFVGRQSPDGGCSSSGRSIGIKMTKTKIGGNVFACFDDGNAGLRCAEIGRRVCGTCVSALYATYWAPFARPGRFSLGHFCHVVCVMMLLVSCGNPGDRSTRKTAGYCI